ncbi:glycosyltransferase family 4 protein [Paenirhodobacter populi]|uniref:Glycosyltransferase family 1 protein n=1 Tax=Paenirhodobacter populi TaxID=2306993 RepID=A0A443IQ91_9RHOB|nr:glycosyltransferase family 4 protein [Sinirhodobacter populi]RWR08161.1 glycosyltransferase family 1 protein [Sinirhodobacter populi]
MIAPITARPRVLLIAEAANPEFVSVPLVGWSVAQALREVADVHLVTQIRNREAILRAGLTEGRDFTVINSEKVAGPLYRAANALRMGSGKGWTLMQAVSSFSYRYFEHVVWQQFGPALRGGEYDIVHRVTPLSPTAQSPIAPKLKAQGVPFVLGPLNGGVPWPAGFDRERRREREWLSYVRGAYKLLPGREATLRSAAAILVGSRHTESEIPDAYREKCVYIPENAIDPERFNLRAVAPGEGPLRICFVGRLVPYKGADMLLEAAAPLLRTGRARIEIIGDGPMRAELEALATREGITAGVTFHGWLEHREVQKVMASCSLLGFPSIREFGGGVVLEAMALGMAPLIVDYAGPGELVTPGTGFKVPIGPREQIIAGVRAELERLVDRPEEIAQAGAAAFDRVQEKFTWARKAEQIAEVYDWVLGRRADRPDPLA